MKKLEHFYRNLNIILIVVVLSIEGITIEKLRESGYERQWVVMLLGIIVLVLVFKFLGFIIEKMVENSEKIRKILLGEDYIEGTWFDIIEIDKNKYYGLYINTYREGQILQNGEQFSAEGLPTNSWRTIVSKYENNTLTIIYQVNYFDVNKIEQPYGISSIFYSKSAGHKAPVSFTGSYYEMTNELSTSSFRGIKITDKRILKGLNDPRLRNETFKELISTYSF